MQILRVHPGPTASGSLSVEPWGLWIVLRVKRERFVLQVPNESLTKKMRRKYMTVVITNFENELIRHSADITYQALGQMHGGFRGIETVSARNKYREKKWEKG